MLPNSTGGTGLMFRRFASSRTWVSSTLRIFSSVAGSTVNATSNRQNPPPFLPSGRSTGKRYL